MTAAPLVTPAADAVEGGTMASPAFRPLQAVVALGAIQALTMAAGLARTKVLALLLGPEGLGIVGVIDQTVALVTHLGSLSLPTAVLHLLSRRRSDTAQELAQLYRAFFVALLVASVVATAIAIGVALWRTTLIADELATFRPVLVLALVAAPALAAAAFLRSVLAALEKHHQAGLFALLGGVLLIGTSYAGVQLGGLKGLYVGNLAVALTTAPLIIWYLRRSGALPSARASQPVLAVLRREEGLLDFCVTIHLLSLFSPVAYLVARVAVLSNHGAAEAGLFYAGYGLALALRVVLGQANALYLAPAVNRSVSKEARGDNALDYLRVLIAVSVVGAVAVVLFPQLWLRLLYSGSFVGAAAFLAAFVLSEMILLVAGVFQTLLLGFRDIRAHALIAVIGQIVLALLSLAWAPGYGSLGVAFAFICGHGVTLLLLLWRVQTRHDSIPVGRALALIAAGFAIIALAGWWSAGANASATVWKLVVLTAAGIGALAVLNAEERRSLLFPWRAWSRRGR